MTERVEAYYFGTHLGPGHYMWGSDGKRVPYGREMDVVTPWNRIDGALQPSRKEGSCAVHHKDGWTALAFANYTDDTRPNSNSVFFIHEHLDFEDAAKAFLRLFPRVTERFGFTLHEASRDERSQDA